ncbi:MAG: DUF5677 domain-containing protein [Terriglobales bacterium]
MQDGTTDAFEEMLAPKVDIDCIANEIDRHKIDAVVFELYKETMRVLNLSAHIMDDTADAAGGLSRNQAICAGLLVRMFKFMMAVIQLSYETSRGEVVLALSRSILESAINLEFLVRANDDRHFNDFVEYSLGPERELYDMIQANIAQRNGEVLPIEKRMLASIGDLCNALERIKDLRFRILIADEKHEQVFVARRA